MELWSLVNPPAGADLLVILIIVAGIFTYLLLLGLGAWVGRRPWGGPVRHFLRLGGLVIVALLTGLAVLGQMGVEPLSQPAATAARIAVIIGAAWLLHNVVSFATQQVEKMMARDETVDAEERAQQARTLAGILHTTALVLIYLIAAMMILSELGFDLTPVLAGAGIAGLTLSLGAQTLVRDLIAGAFILLENQFAVGDSIQVGDVSGSVERMTLRATFIRDLQGTLHVVPNGEIRVLSNRTKDWARAVVNVAVPYEVDVEQTLAVLREVAADVAEDGALGPLLLEPPTVSGVEDLADSAVMVRLLAKVKPGRQWEVARAMRLRILKAMDAAGISLPYPQLTVHLAQDAGGPLPRAG
jgi:small conductance mechanosensitive channel